jgi:hypothetical protein
MVLACQVLYHPIPVEIIEIESANYFLLKLRICLI